MAEPPSRREVGGHWRMWRAARRADRLIRTGRSGEAWELVPRLPLAGALRVVARLAASGWSPLGPARGVFDRVLPAASLDPERVAPLLSGAAVPLTAIPGPRPVAALSFAPDAPTLAIARYDHGLETWDVRSGRLLHRHPSPDPETGLSSPAPPTLLPTMPGPLFIKRVLCLTGGRVLATAGRATGPYRDLLLARDDSLRHLARLPQEIAALLPLPGAGAALTYDGQVWVHSDDGATYRGVALELDEQAVPLWDATCSPDGRLVAVHSDRWASVHDRRTGRMLARTGPLPRLPGREEVTIRPSPELLPGLRVTAGVGRIISVAVRPDAAGLVVGTAEGATRLLDLDFNHQGELRPHRYGPTVLAAPAGGLVATTKTGVTRVYRWPVRDGPLELPTGAESPEGPVALSPRGWLLAAARAGQLRTGPATKVEQPDAGGVGLWDLTPWVLAPLLRRALGTVGADEMAVVREARTAAGVYRADEPTVLALDALLALLEDHVH